MRERDLGLGVLAFLLGAACHAPSTVLTPETRPMVADELRADPPIEVAVLPVARRAGLGDAALQVMRRAAYEELLDKGYTPLDLEHVASRVSDAVAENRVDWDAVVERLRADSYLTLDVLRVDLSEGGRRRVSVFARLVDGETRAVLFEHGRVETAPNWDQEVSGAMLANLARRILTQLPAR